MVLGYCCAVLYFCFFSQETAQHQREVLFQQKLKLCTVVFDMTDPMENSRWVKGRVVRVRCPKVKVTSLTSP